MPCITRNDFKAASESAWMLNGNINWLRFGYGANAVKR